jgi:inner membrane protein
MPETMPAALPVIAGAAAGSLVCDIDCDSPRERQDASRQRILAVLITAAALIADKLSDAGMCRSLAQSGSYLWCAGIAGFVMTLAFANVSAHRGFSHSLTALALETFCVYLIFPQCALPFAAAFISHILLDMTNKKRVRLFYPAKKGVSLGLFYADRLANRVCEIAGTVWLILVIWVSTGN